MSVSIELAQVPEVKPAWELGQLDFRRPTEASELTDSFAGTLFKSIAEPDARDFAVVDLELGKSWLSSRLFLASLLLEQLRQLRAFVFVYSVDDIDRKFLGVSSPHSVREGLMAAEPWLGEALALATYERVTKEQRQGGEPVRPTETMEAYFGRIKGNANEVPQLGQAFLENVQSSAKPTEADKKNWIKLPDQDSPCWEHATWVTAETITRGSLRGRVARDTSIVAQDDWTDLDQISAVVKKPRPFVALLSSYPPGRFEQLVDRSDLLEIVTKASMNDHRL